MWVILLVLFSFLNDLFKKPLIVSLNDTISAHSDSIFWKVYINSDVFIVNFSLRNKYLLFNGLQGYILKLTINLDYKLQRSSMKAIVIDFH